MPQSNGSRWGPLRNWQPHTPGEKPCILWASGPVSDEFPDMSLSYQFPGEGTSSEGTVLQLCSHMGILGCLVKDCRAGRSLAFPVNWAENHSIGVLWANVPSLQGNTPALRTHLIIPMTCFCHRNYFYSQSSPQDTQPWGNEHGINTGIK